MKSVAERIRELEAMLDTGTTQLKVDGLVIHVDPTEIRRRLAELKEQDAASTRKRPRVISIDLSGC